MRKVNNPLVQLMRMVWQVGGVDWVKQYGWGEGGRVLEQAEGASAMRALPANGPAAGGR